VSADKKRPGAGYCCWRVAAHIAQNKSRRSGCEWQRHINKIKTDSVRARLGGILLKAKNEHKSRENTTEISDVCEDDDRMFLKVKILGVSVVSLLDCGASVCVLGGPGMHLLDELDLKVNPCSIKNIEMADKSCQPVAGQVDLPIELNGECFVINALVVPSVDQCLILGLNFWLTTSFVPDVSKGEYSFSHKLAPNNVMKNDCCLCSVKSSVGTNNQDGCSLSAEQRVKFDQFIAETKASFSEKLGRCNFFEYDIDTGQNPPCKTKQFYLPPSKLELIYKIIDKMLEMDVIEPCISAWSSPIFLVHSPDGTKEPRFVCDMRKVNELTSDDAYGVPLLMNVIDNLGDAKFLSTIDLRKSYWQVPLNEKSKPKTAFFIPGKGQFQFKVIPFGAKNSGPGFMRAMDALLSKSWIRKYIHIYIDDVVVATPTFELHIKVLAELFRLLREGNMTPNWDKCKFLRDSFNILGFVFDKFGLHTDPNKVTAILNLARPINRKGIKQFFGAASYYRRLVSNFSAMAEPMLRLLKKDVPFTWGEEQEKAFISIKNALVSDPVVRLPDFSKTFYLSTDASDVGISGVLTQYFEDGEHPIYYVSRLLNDAERNYPTIHKEALAILWSIEKLEGYLTYGKFILASDCKPLKYIRSVKNPKGLIAHWNFKLQKYTFEPMHKPGVLNSVPDILSRSF
jgi:hypothetical protein